MNYAVVGTGSISQSFIEAAGRVPDMKLYGICSRTLPKAAAMSEKHGGAKAFDDLDTMLADDRVELVYLASPNAVHFGQMMRALERGKHVICEKSFVSNAASSARRRSWLRRRIFSSSRPSPTSICPTFGSSGGCCPGLPLCGR